MCAALAVEADLPDVERPGPKWGRQILDAPKMGCEAAGHEFPFLSHDSSPHRGTSHIAESESRL